MKLIFVIICFSIFIFTSCKKQVEKERSEFIGYWHSDNGDGIDLNILEDSYAIYSICWEGKNITHTGIARANDHYLKMGRLMHWDIIEYPHIIDTSTSNVYVYTDNTNKIIMKANWKMTLDGLKPSAFYVCGKYDYYKADY